jgi:hypothetical protein
VNSGSVRGTGYELLAIDEPIYSLFGVGVELVRCPRRTISSRTDIREPAVAVVRNCLVALRIPAVSAIAAIYTTSAQGSIQVHEKVAYSLNVLVVGVRLLKVNVHVVFDPVDRLHSAVNSHHDIFGRSLGFLKNLSLGS